MPVKSKQQLKLMAGICSGSIKPRKGLPSKKVACEFLKRTKTTKGLPRRVKKRK